MAKGAKLGENRFKDSQQININDRSSRLREEVVPKMKAMCEAVHFPNKTIYQKMCAEVFNEDLPVNMNKITHRTIATNSKYWIIVGEVYHKYYDSGDSKSLADLKKQAINKLNSHEKMDGLTQENIQLKRENEALKAYIAKNKLKDKTPPATSTIDREVVDNLIATLDFLVKATDGIVEINKEQRTIVNLADDFNGFLSKHISSTYFDILEGKR